MKRKNILQPTSAFSAFLFSMFLFIGCKNKEHVKEVQGIFEAEELYVASPIDGQIKQFFVREGDIVEQGQTLILMDTTMMVYQKEYLESQQNNARSSGVISAQNQTSALDVQINALEKEKEKIVRLVKREILPGSKLNEIQSKIDAAKAQKNAAKEQINASNKGHSGQANALDSQRDQIAEMIKRSTIKAPISGCVLATYANSSEYTAAGRPLLKLADIKNLTLKIYLTIEELEWIKIGDTLTVQSDMGGKSDRSYEGKVVWIADKAEFTPKNIQTSASRSSLIYAAKVRLNNDGYLKIGEYGKAIIPKRENAKR